MKKTLSLLLSLVLMLSLALPASAAETEYPTLEGGVTEIQKYGNIVLDIDPADLKDGGYTYGDLLTVTVNGTGYDMPLCTNYSDVDTGALVLRDSEGVLIAAINMGDFATSNGLAAKVTAEDGSAKTYTITVQVAQAPTLFLDYNGQRLGVVKDVSQVTPPAGFAPAEPITYSGDTLPIWTDVSGKRTLVYLMDEKTSAQGFYLFSQTTGVQSPYLPILCGSVTYIYTDIPKELSSVPGLTPATVKAFGQTLNGWTYNDASLKDFCVLYLMDDAGSYGYYTYDSREETLQRFSGAVFADDAGQSLRVPMLYVYIAGGAAALLLILLIVFASVAGSRGRKLRLLADTGASQPVLDEGTPEATPDATPADDTAPELEQLPVASPQEDPSLSADVPVSPAGTPAPEATLPESAAEASTSEAGAAPSEPAPDAALENTLRHLPLDELLRDIHDL